MNSIKGKRKFIIVLVALCGAFILSALAIVNAAGQAIGIIGAIGGTTTAITIPFMTSNFGENKAEANAAKTV